MEADRRSGPRTDLTGRIFGELRVVGLGSHREPHRIYWRCECSACGGVTEVRADALTNKTKPSQSCGCRAAGGFKHGGTNSLTYVTWLSMKARCLNPTSPSYHLYGGRGIVICDHWLNSFENFLADMGPRPSAKHSIDRINSDGNYEPGNCRWADTIEQASNTSRNVLLTFAGKTQTISAWAREVGLEPETLRRRIATSGWSIERALTTPTGKSGPMPGFRKET